jgi:16S rRNA (guanine527-N7)-methyltransferase
VTTIESGLASLGLPDYRIAASLTPLTTYLRDLERGARRYGLLSAEDAASSDRIADRHILDSLGAWRTVERWARSAISAHGVRPRLVDLGSGAGLPGVPLAIVLGDLLSSCILVERKEKRARFLRAVVAALPDVALEVREADAGMISIDDAIVVFRAYAPVSAHLLDTLAASFPPGTPIAMYKGRRAAAEEEAAMLRADARFAEVRVERADTVPGATTERTLLLAEISRVC